MTSVRIRQIYFSPVHLGMLDPEFEPYKNVGVTPYFENHVIRELHQNNDHKKSDYYGVFSYKFWNKHQRTGEQINALMNRDEYSSDVYTFFKKETENMRQGSKINTFYDPYHPNLLEIGCKLVKRLFGEDLTKISAERIYYNHWISKSDIFEDYCRDALLPAIELMETELKDLCDADSKYNNTVLSSYLDAYQIMTPEKCRTVFGKPYYPHHPFVLERLPSIYFAVRNLKVTHI